ncbi:MAG: hypothetical protein QM747_13625 [Nocardioides sp.]
MQTLDWIVIALFLLSQLVVGFYCEKKSGNSVEDFFLAGRKLTWWLLGTSMVATAFASDTPLFITKLVRQYGLSGAWYYWNASLNGLLAAFFISFLWRRTHVISDAEFRELRYSGTAGKAVRAGWAVYWSGAATFFSLAWVILAMVKIAKAVFELSDTMMIAGHEMQTSVVVVAISLVITGAYSAASGLWGVIVTDFIQFILAFLGTALLAWFAVDHVGGLPALKTQLAALPDAPPAAFDFIPTAGTVLVVFWVGMTIQWVVVGVGRRRHDDGAAQSRGKIGETLRARPLLGPSRADGHHRVAVGADGPVFADRFFPPASIRPSPPIPSPPTR